MKANINKSFIL